MTTSDRGTEECLRQDNDRFRRLFQLAADALFLHDLQGRFVEVNQVACESLGYTREKLLQLPFSAIVPGEGPEALVEMWARVLEGEKLTVQGLHQRRDGTTFSVEVHLAPFEYAGRPHILASARDVSERQRAEDALQKEKMFTEALLDSLPGTFFLIDSQGKHLRTNTSGLVVSGYSWEELSNMHALEFIAPEDRPATQRAMEDVFAKGEASLEAHLLSKEGRKTPFLFTAKKFIMDNMPCILGTGLDITTFKQAEEGLRESEERYRSLFQNSHSVMLLIDPFTGAIMDANPTACAYYGFSRGKLLAKKITDINMLTPEQVFREMEKAKTEKRKQFEFRHRLANGEIRDVEVFSGPIRVQGKELLYSIIHDVTARKQAEAALAESEQRFSVFMEHLPAATFIKDQAGRVLFANRYHQELFGWQECLGKNTAELLPPEIAERMMADDQIVLSEGPIVIPERITDIHGVERLFDTYKFPLTAEGSPTLLGGIAIDMTERKRMQEALEKRLVALSRPLDDTADLDFHDLFNLQDIQRIQDLFAKITGVSSLITTPEGVPITQPSNFCRLCRDIIRQTELGRQRCFASDAALGRYNPDGPTIRYCLSAGLCGAGASITVGGKHIANWLIGQVRDETQDEKGLRDYARTLGVDEDEFLTAFREVPTMSADNFQQVAQALFVFSSQLSAMAYQNIQQARFITERQRAEEALRDSERRLSEIIDFLPDATLAIDLSGKVIAWNRAIEEMTGVKAESIIGKGDYEYAFPFYGVRRPVLIDLVLKSDEEIEKKYAFIKRKGDILWAETDVPLKGEVHLLWGKARPLYDSEGNILGAIEAIRDITERKRAEEERAKLEAQMREVQKLESLGVLAGGIAHDFNNLLMAILGNADLALLSLSPASPARPHVEEITRASQRAADLCRQMLAYSGKGRFVVGRYDLSEIVREMAQMLEVSVSKKATLRYSFATDLPPVEADATQLRQVILNLITNASEALGDASGVISVSTGVMECDRAYLSESYLGDNLPEGRYVYLEVADTGYGMDEETRRRIFDPFFTTKFTGRGLGLAAVLGIVRGHQGAIKVYSEPGRGSTFKILLPAAAWTPEDLALKITPITLPCSGGTILLVDDDPFICQVGMQMLQRLGFTVLTATHGREGLEVFREHQREIDCVILDLTMPEMGGEETFRELRRLRSDVCVILSSGYNEQDVVQQFAGKGLAGFIQKPYTVAKLRETLNDVLGPK